MPLLLQSKLLRVLQEQEFEPVGSNKVVKVDVRIIAATSVDLPKLVEQGRFRADLFYRLNVLSLTVPPLRERAADLEMLCENILEQIELRSGLPHRELLPDAVERLRQCTWRGNVRELQNVLEKVVMLSDKALLDVTDLEGILPASVLPADGVSPLPAPQTPTYATAFEEFERKLLNEALLAAQGRVELAAKRLGLGRATLYRKLQLMGLVSKN